MARNSYAKLHRVKVTARNVKNIGPRSRSGAPSTSNTTKSTSNTMRSAQPSSTTESQQRGGSGSESDQQGGIEDFSDPEMFGGGGDFLSSDEMPAESQHRADDRRKVNADPLVLTYDELLLPLRPVAAAAASTTTSSTETKPDVEFKSTPASLILPAISGSRVFILQVHIRLCFQPLRLG